MYVRGHSAKSEGTLYELLTIPCEESRLKGGYTVENPCNPFKIRWAWRQAD